MPVLHDCVIFRVNRLLERKTHSARQAVNFRRRRGAQIDAHRGRFWNRIHRCAAPDDTYVERGLRRHWNRSLTEYLNGARESNDRIGRSEVAPGMAAGAAAY